MRNQPVSIIVIAHTNSFTLPSTLKSVDLYSQKTDQKILVLNNPSPDVSLVAENFSSDWTVLFEKMPGPQHARNAGADNALHKYLVFLDDDVQLTEGWIDTMLEGFITPWVGAAQGFIRFEKNKSFFWNYLRLIELENFKKAHKNQEETNYLDTAAIIIKKSWFNSLKGFHHDLSRCEDTYFSYQLRSNGGKVFTTTKTHVIQTYSPKETFWSALGKIKAMAPYYILLQKKIHSPNYIQTPQINIFRLKKFPAYFCLGLFYQIALEVFANRYRSTLDPIQSSNIPQKLRKNLER